MYAFYSVDRSFWVCFGLFVCPDRNMSAAAAADTPAPPQPQPQPQTPAASTASPATNWHAMKAVQEKARANAAKKAADAKRTGVVESVVWYERKNSLNTRQNWNGWEGNPNVLGGRQKNTTNL